MEDVLDLYHEACDPERPVVCFDETSRQLVEDVRPPIKAKPGRVERYDTEYQRNGTRNLFMFCEPKGGWRHVEVTERRTAVDFAHQMRWLVDQAYPHARVVRLVLDNLNTHKLGSLYEAFGASEARRIAKRLEFHHTPTHGSWLNMAEIELSVFSRQCLNRRVGDEVLRREVAALERERNDAGAVIDWRFSTQDARSKLQHIYPSGLNGNGTSRGPTWFPASAGMTGGGESRGPRPWGLGANHCPRTTVHWLGANVVSGFRRNDGWGGESRGPRPWGVGANHCLLTTVHW